MGIAYVLINCDLGSEEEVISHLKLISDIKEVQGTFGAYDIFAKLESTDVKKLRNTITEQIRKIERVRSTLTLMTIDSQS